uniref:Transmembrane protein n=1 Tax=Bursaphelenchus xylophilus TaxID=6326 RepID=A0A1I7SW73_BURXY
MMRSDARKGHAECLGHPKAAGEKRTARLGSTKRGSVGLYDVHSVPSLSSPHSLFLSRHLTTQSFASALPSTDQTSAVARSRVPRSQRSSGQSDATFRVRCGHALFGVALLPFLLFGSRALVVLFRIIHPFVVWV